MRLSSDHLCSGASRSTCPHKPIVPVESAAAMHYSKVIVKLSICLLTDMEPAKPGHFRPKIDRNVTFHFFTRGVAADWASTLYGTSTPAQTYLTVGSAGCTRLG